MAYRRPVAMPRPRLLRAVFHVVRVTVIGVVVGMLIIAAALLALHTLR